VEPGNFKYNTHKIFSDISRTYAFYEEKNKKKRIRKKERMQMSSCLGRYVSIGIGIERERGETPDAGDIEDVVRRPRRTVI